MTTVVWLQDTPPCLSWRPEADITRSVLLACRFLTLPVLSTPAPWELLEDSVAAVV